MDKPVELPNIRNITISGRIASGATTLAHHVAQYLGWEILDGGKLFREFTKDHGFADHRPDQFDLDYEEKTRESALFSDHQLKFCWLRAAWASLGQPFRQPLE